MPLLTDIVNWLIKIPILAWRAFIWIVLSIFRAPLNRYITQRLNSAGITVNGDQPHDMRVHHRDVFIRMTRDLSLGFGESYMEGWWDCDQLDEMIYRMLKSGLDRNFMVPWTRTMRNFFQFGRSSVHSVEKAFDVAKTHYDLGNDLFRSFLGPTMKYSCGYWKNATDLDEAQLHSLDLIGRKLKLRPGMRVLDIGCGWGSLCKHLAQNFGVSVVGITVGKEGANVAKELCKGLSVEIRLQDYRQLEEDEKFDRIVCIEMLEHVGRRNYETFFKVCNRSLSDNGLILLQVLTNVSKWLPSEDPFLKAHVFGNVRFPKPADITEVVQDLFAVEDWQNFDKCHERTFLAWRENFVNNWMGTEKNLEDPNKLYRMWNFLFLSSAGTFRSRRMQTWQIVLSKNADLGAYEPVR